MGGLCAHPPPPRPPASQQQQRQQRSPSQAQAQRGGSVRQTPEELAAAELLREIGKNKPLRGERPVWSAPHPITLEEAMRQRETFWDTAPAYEGRREIWDALKAACETEDLTLAQAILDSAGIKLPTGSLEVAYDERGARYALPPICLSMPSNLIQGNSASARAMSTGSVVSVASVAAPGTTFPIKVRLSTCQDVPMQVNLSTTCYAVKQHVCAQTKLDPTSLRVTFCGKLLTDDTDLGSLSFAKSDVLQVFVFPSH